MKKEEKRRLIIIVTVIIAAVILWLLLRGKGPGQNIVRKTDALNFSVPGADPWNMQGIPPLDYVPGDVNYVGGSKGCVLCYSGYQRLEVPSPPQPAYREPIPVQNIYNYVQSQPQPLPYMSFDFGGGNMLNMSR